LRRLIPAVLLLLAASAFAGAVGVKADKEYAPHKRIVLKATEVTSAKAQFLWDVDGGADVVEAGDTLYVWAAPGTYKVTLTAIDFDAKKVERASFTFRVTGEQPRPPPGPDPGPGPGPGPAPPAPKGDLRVLVVYEEQEARDYPKEQHSILYGKKFHDALNARTPLNPTTKRHEWNVWDKDTDVKSMPKAWQDLMARPRKSLPWIVLAGDDGVFHEGPLPKTPAEAISLVDKYAPKKGGRR
jgi:hypothetical protein